MMVQASTTILQNCLSSHIINGEEVIGKISYLSVLKMECFQSKTQIGMTLELLV